MTDNTAGPAFRQDHVQQRAAKVPVGGTLPGGAMRFTERELDILQLMAHGATNLEIGTRLFISRYTVAQHVASMLRKAECRTRAHLVYWAVVTKVIDLCPPCRFSHAPRSQEDTCWQVLHALSPRHTSVKAGQRTHLMLGICANPFESYLQRRQQELPVKPTFKRGAWWIRNI